MLSPLWIRQTNTPAPTQSFSMNSIGSEESMGVITLSPGPVSLALSSILSQSALGDIELLPGAVSFSMPGIEGDAMVPNPTFSVGGSTVSLVAIPSEEFVGLPVLSPGAVSFSAAFISESSVLGDIHFSTGLVNFSVPGITPGEQVQPFNIENVNHVLRLSSIETAETFGAISIKGGSRITGYMNADIFTGPALLGVVEVNLGH
ncbi:hypothetical protein GCM10007891_05380 [Methylophaga thalassica]|uniref:Uncharacterized protein n=1 Tax=Methylophaga thalassica TaxID=40223 RepID=A0ABQ5TQZ8_9GAMM|nr:hypothetical protein [Methylophaga thalassica]GLP98684.1 hypothetical protein GCM10007891_05380 [Methylophaga thalassica]